MPLRVAELSNEPLVENYLVFYSSLVNGKLWCPDCEAVDDIVQKTFGTAEGPSALMIYVGGKAEWKSPCNRFRGAPWKIHTIPTIIKIRNSEEDARLTDKEINDQLSSFIQESD